MDIVVIDVPNAWGTLLCHKWVVDLGCNFQMDFSYATIPTVEGTFVVPHKELMKKHHVEEPQDLENQWA